MKQVSSIRARCTGAPSSHLRDAHLVGKWGSPQEVAQSRISGDHSSLFLSLRFLSSMRPSLMPLEGRREMTAFLPSPMTNTFDERVAKWLPVESLMWAMSKELGCLSTCWRIPTRPMLLPPMMSTWAPFSYLMRLSTSPLSRLTYKGLIFNIKNIQREWKKRDIQ